MNIRQIKLALTIELLNSSSQNDPFDGVKKVMQQFQSDAGKFTGLLVSSKDLINNAFESQWAALQFEKCTVNLEMITNLKSRQKYIQNFHLEASQAA